MRAVKTIRKNPFFIGRDKELEYFKKLIKQKVEHTILYIHGEGGIGKSLLLKEFEQLCKEKIVPVALIDERVAKGTFPILQSIHDQFKDMSIKTKEYNKGCEKYFKLLAKLHTNKDIPKSVLKFIGSGFISIGKIAISETITPGSSIPTLATLGKGVLDGPVEEGIISKGIESIADKIFNFLSPQDIRFLLNPSEELTERLVEDINSYTKRRPLVIMFDTYETIGALEDWVCEFVKSLRGATIIVIDGRREKLDNIGDDKWRRIGYSSMELDMFNETEGREYLVEKRGITDNGIVNDIMNFAERLPLAFSVAADAVERFGLSSFSNIPIKGEVIEKIISQIIKEVNLKRWKILRACAVVRSFNEDILSEVLGIECASEIYDELNSTTFVKRHVSGLTLHERIRDYLSEIFKHRSPAKYREINKKAADFYREESQKAESYEAQQRLTIEWLYHLLRANKTKGVKLFLYLSVEANKLHQRIFSWQLAEEIKMCLLDDIDNELKFKVKNGLGVVARHQGKIDEAIRYFKESWDIHQQIENRNEFRETEILRLLGEAYLSKGRYDQAIKYLSNSLKMRQDLSLKDKYYHDKARLAYWPWAKTDDELKYSILDGKSKVMLSMAKAYLWQNRTDKSLKYSKEALEIAKLLGDKFRIAQSYRMIGDICFKKGELDEAFTHCKDAERLFKKTVGQNDIATGWVLRKLGEIHQARGELNEGEKYFYKALDIFQNSKMSTNLGVAATLVSLSNLWYLKGIEIDQFAKEAEKYTYYEQLSLLRRIQGDFKFDKAQYQEAFDFYAQSCVNALYYSRYLLDEMIDKIVIQINTLINNNKLGMAIKLCNFLINYWGEYEYEEAEARQIDIGDGKTQIPLIERLQQEIVKISR